MTVAAVRGPRRVFNVLEDGCRDVAVADDVLSGRFTAAGRTLALGPDPDWSADPCPEDKEWRVEWVKFYYGLDLAHAFGVTGDARYLRAWETLVRGFMRQVPAASDDTEVMARRVQNWIYAWNRFDRPSGIGAATAGPVPDAVDPSLGPDIVDYLWSEVEHVKAHLSAERNHRTLELYALLVAAVALPDRDPDHALRQFALEQLHANLLTDVWPDGVHREASTHYHCIALRSWLGALEHASEAGIVLPASYRERLALACEFAMYAHRPDGRIPAYSDADSESYRDVLLLAASLFGREDWRWVATGGRAGCPPAACSASFDRAGYYTMRSGWGETCEAFGDARFLMFDCGPLGDGGHGHYDLLSVEAYAHGRPLLVDPGRYTYSEAGDENWRRWFKGTSAHNTVVVDGLDQTPYARRKPKGPIAVGTLLARTSAPGLDMVIGEARSPLYDAVHTRTVLFAANEYWVVVDQLSAQRRHRYALRWHLSPEAGEEVRCEPGLVRATGVSLAFAPVRTVRVEPGWFAPRYGVKHPAPVVVVEAEAQTTAFVTVIGPHGGNGANPARIPLTVGFIKRGDRTSERSLLEIRGVGPDGTDSDLLTWSTERDFIELAGFRGRARVAWARRDACDRPLAFVAGDVTESARRHGDHYEAMEPAAGWVSWSASSPTPSKGRRSL